MIPHEVLDTLNEKMVQDAYELQGRKASPFNYNKGNIQQDPPLTGEWFSDEIFLSEYQLFATPSSRSVLVLTYPSLSMSVTGPVSTFVTSTPFLTE